MKRVFLLFAGLWLISQAGFSQDRVIYEYDSAGNRVGRTIAPSTRSSEPKEEEPVVFPEVLSGLDISVYPNPTDGWIRMDIQNLPEGETANIWLYSLSGNLVVSKQNVASSMEIDITGQPAGIYLLKVVAGEQQGEWRIIKK